MFRTIWTDGIRQMIAAWRGGPSLRSNEDFRLLAQGLQDLKTYTAFLSDQTEGPQQAAAALAEATASPTDRSWVQSAWALQGGAPVLQPYVLLGVGVDASGEPYTGVALVHANDAAARDNAQLVQQRISQAVSIADGMPWSSRFKSVEVRVSGRVLEVTLKGSAIGVAFVFRRDPLFLHR